MKKYIAIFAILMLVVTLFQFESFAQRQTKITKGFSVSEYLGTVANSSQETAYLDLREWSKVDSVVVSLSATNETDVDTVNFYIGNYTPTGGFVSDAAAGVLYQASTLDVAASGTDFLALLTSNATKLTGAALRGANGIKAVLEVSAAGNDATDPNALYINWRIYGTK